MRTEPDEFKKFIRFLLANAPTNYKPHLFRCEKDGKAPKLEYGSWKDRQQRIGSKKGLWWLKNEGNVGIAGMPDDPLINVDIDDEEATEKQDLKPTLMARSRSRTGIHAWYFSNDNIPNIPTDDAGEVRAKGQYVIAPGSYAYCEKDVENAGHYTVEEGRPVSWIDLEDLPVVFRERVRERKEEKKLEHKKVDFNPKNAEGEYSTLYDISARDVVAREGGSTKPTDRWTALFHDSITEMNMSLSREGLLHCWRHEVSLNGLQAMTVLSGYMSCMEAGSPHRGSNTGTSKVIGDDGAIFNAWKYAKEEGYVSEEDSIPVRALDYIAKKHDICDPSKFEILPRWAYNKVLEIVEEEY